MKHPSKRLQILLAVALLLYACGYVTQFIGNYAVWQKNGGMLGGTSPPFPSLSPPDCFKGILWFPYNLYCMAGCAAAVAAIFLYRKLFTQDALTDSERNFDFSAKGTYGTSGWMQPRQIPAVLDMLSDLSQHTGTVLGMLDGKFLCIPEKTRMNGNLAVYGASGSMKTRSFCMNRILQSAARGESLIICDPKSELYEKSSEYMRDLGYTVRVFNLVSPENSDSWNCLKEIEGQELMAQLFVDVIIKNTNGTGKSDRFWDSGEMNLLKALVLYVDLTYPLEQRNIGEVYNLITQCSESQLDSLFDVLPLTHPAKAPYSLYQRASDSVRSGVISGLGSRLQVFQSELIKKITAYDEISLELPGQQPCAYYLVTSDQDSTFDFLASLFLSFAFIKLVRYADANCPGGRLPVPVHILGEELTACGTISELSRRISVIRSRNISMSCVPAVLNENLPLLFILLLWDFFHQIIYTAMQDTCQAQQGFPLRLVNVFLALLILLDGAHRDFCLSCQFRLAHFGQCAQALQVCFRLCCTVQFVHLISKLVNVHFMVGRIQHSHLGNRHSLLNFREAQPGIPLVICDSPARPVFGTAVIRIGCLADGFWLPRLFQYPAGKFHTGSACQNSAITEFKAVGNLAH